jgi:hypothetical protein
LPPWLGITLTLLVCGFAIWRGGWEERTAGTAALLSTAITVLLRDNSWPNLQLAAFIADGLLFVVFLILALRTEKYWPLAAAGFQLLAVLTHMAKLVDTQLQQWAYITAQVIWTYLILIAIVTGTVNSVRRRRYPAANAAAPAGVARR